jgi:hypothetical protein
VSHFTSGKSLSPTIIEATIAVKAFNMLAQLNNVSGLAGLPDNSANPYP